MFWWIVLLDFYESPERLRKAILHVNSYDRCFNDKKYASQEICATSTVEEGKACKVYLPYKALLICEYFVQTQIGN